MKLLVQAFLSGTFESDTPNSSSLKQNGLMFPATSYVSFPVPRVDPTIFPRSLFYVRSDESLLKQHSLPALIFLGKKMRGILYLMVSSISAPKQCYGRPCINYLESCHWKLETGKSQKARLPSDRPSWRLLGLRWKRRRAGHVPLCALGLLPCPSSHKTAS